jgi:hypothetical protein
MLRSAFLLVAILAAGSASAQFQEEADIDFILRPTQDSASGSDEFWINQLAPEQADEEIGPPLAGPTGEEPIGPPLAGPVVSEPDRQLRARRIVEEEDPFAPTGIAIGTFIIRPSIEVGVNATDNPAGTPEKNYAAGLIVAPEVLIARDGARLDVEGELRGEAILYPEDEFDEREAEARLAVRYDLTSRTELEAEAAYLYDLDRFSDPNTPDAAAERPAVHELEAGLGVTQRFGRLALGVAGTVERSVHEDVALSGGGTASRGELDNTEYGFRLRTSYEASPAFAPFVEAGAGRRDFDQEVDDSGFERSSLWGELRGGLIFDRGGKLRGEVSLGYRSEDLEDENLDDLDGMIAEAAILWSPRRLTEVHFDFSTELRPTSIPDSSGSLLYSGTLTVARRVGARFRLEAGAGLDREHFEGVDRDDVTYTGFTGFTYAFNRAASLKARYVYEQTESDDPSADAKVNSVSMRIRVQR